MIILWLKNRAINQSPILVDVPQIFVTMRFVYTVICFLVLASTAIGQGIEFFEGSYKEALVKAQAEEKLIFVDAYATWCGPCKRMAKNVFTNPEVGDYYNQAFIALKIDMEKPQGREFGQLFPVRAYPTLFYINEKGALLKKVVGGKSVDQFLALGQEIAGSYDRSGDLAAQYEEGERDFDVVLKYVKALNNANKSSLKVANDYLRENKALTEEQRAAFLYEAMTTSDSRLFSLFIKDRDAITSLVGDEKVDQKILDACWKTIDNAIAFDSPDLLNEAKDKMSDHLKAQAKSFGFDADYEYAKSQADLNLLKVAALNIAKHNAKKDAERLHDICNELLQYKSIDGSVSEVSEKIAKMATDQEKSAEYMFTYSKILLENNKQKKALSTAKKALELSDDDDDRKEIEEWIKHNTSK